MECLNCGKESKGKYCSGACRAADYRKRTQNTTGSAQNTVRTDSTGAQTEAHAESAQRLKPDDVLSMSIEDIIKLPLDKAKTILRSWAMGIGNTKQYMLGNLAIEYDVTKYNYPVSHLIPRKTNQNQLQA